MESKRLKIITVSGKAGGGKDTFGELLKVSLEDIGKKAVIYRYGDPLKYICRTFLGWDGQKDERGRSMLQMIGTDVVRAKKPDYWVNYLLEILDLIGDKMDAEYIIITDARFENEIQGLKDAGYDVTSIDIVRPNADSTLTEEQQNHPSETELDGYVKDVTVYNDGGFHELCQKARKFAGMIDKCGVIPKGVVL